MRLTSPVRAVISWLCLTAGLIAQQPATIRPPTNREPSVKPGINDRFLDPELDVDEWIGRFEVESREVYTARNAVLAACEVRPGMRIADVGAGTGLYTRLFAEAVGSEGWVYAVEIAPRFLEHIEERASHDKLPNITCVLGSQDAIRLPPESVDLVFTCDTYHHFEFPASTLTSIHSALRPGGTLVIVDFERIEGVSRDWTIGHVRAGKPVVRREIEAAGFAFEREANVDGLSENYCLRFTKR